jgi:hypothetical protein
MAEEKIELLKNNIRDILSTLNRTTTSKDLMKEFHHREGGNINVKLAEVEFLNKLIFPNLNALCKISI